MTTFDTIYYYVWFLSENTTATLIDDLQTRINNNEKILFLSCNGALKYCWHNPTGKKSICKRCRFYKNSIPQLRSPQVTHEYIDAAYHKEASGESFEQLELNYKSVPDIKDITYDGVKLGYGCYSFYVSKTNNIYPLIDDTFSSYFNLLLRTSFYLSRVLDAYMLKYKDGLKDVTTFNGRPFDVRPVFDLAIKHEVDFRSVEIIHIERYHTVKEVYWNVLPHNQAYRCSRALETWHSSTRTEEEKLEIGTNFFKKKKKGNEFRGIKSYISTQNIGKLPSEWDEEKTNIVIFNSSEFEIAGVPEFSAHNLFQSQEEAFTYILEHVSDYHIQFYLRIHPNMNGIDFGYHTRLYALESRYSNITVIAPDDPVSTYELIDRCDKMITFFSATGAEGCYWGKPVISLSRAAYYCLDLTYSPTDGLELIDMIRRDRLPAKDRKQALIYGYYLMAFDTYTEPISFNPRLKNLLGLRSFYVYPHMKILGSSHLMKFLIWIRYNLPRKYLSRRSTIDLPIKEQVLRV